MGSSAEFEVNKASVQRLVDEALNGGTLEVVDETLGEPAERVKAMTRLWRAAFPDLYTTVKTMVAEDDWVAVHLCHQGTHEGEFSESRQLGSTSTSER
jgi:predicted ester cyclase